MSDTRLWMVVSMDDIEDGDIRWLDCWRLPANRRPSVLHWHRESAEREAERLVTKHSGEFAIFELVAKVKQGPLMPCGPLMRAPVYERPCACKSGSTPQP